MCHQAASCLMQGRNVLYITLEMAEERIAERIDANLMDLTIDELHELPKKMFESSVDKIKNKTQGTLGSQGVSYCICTYRTLQRVTEGTCIET